MDNKFQTSFIPKRPILIDQKVKSHGGGTSVFMFVSIIIFTISLAGAIFSFAWKNILVKNQETYIQELKKAEERFDIGLIDKLRKANTKIDLANQLLKKHIRVSEIFAIINSLTTEGIRFNSFEFSAPDTEKEKDTLKISMKGTGNSFASIAWQSDVFGKSIKFGKNKVLKNPIITDLIINPNGSVGFSFSAYLKSDDISYEKLLVAESAVSSNEPIEPTVDTIDTVTETSQ